MREIIDKHKLPIHILAASLKSPEEAVAACLGAELVQDIWGQLYEEAAQGALAKIENVLPDDQRDEVAWARRTLRGFVMERMRGVTSGERELREEMRRLWI